MKYNYQKYLVLHICNRNGEKMKPIPISVCIIAKNEERYLSGCLDKLAPYNFEIIVADTGSTDHTIEIANKYTPHVYSFPWIDDFSAARNFVASKASNDWILSLDCDEYIADANIVECTSLIRMHNKGIGEITVINKLKNLDGNIGQSEYKIARLYNRQFSHFEGMIHEQIRNKSGNPSEKFLCPMSVLHYGYFQSPDEIIKKNERNITLLKKQISISPNEPYFYFQLNQSYLAIDKYEDAYLCLKKAIALNPDQAQKYVHKLYIDYGKCLLKTNRISEALVMENYFDLLHNYSDYLYVLGQIYYRNNYPIKAIQSFVNATTAPDCIAWGTNSIFPLKYMSIIYEQLGERELSKQCDNQIELLVQDKII